MNNEFSGLSKVFSFTFTRYTDAKGYKITTAVTAVLLFIVPIIIFACIGFFGFENEPQEPTFVCNAEKIYVVDETESAFDPNVLNSLGIDGFDSFDYISAKSLDEALLSANENRHSLVLTVEKFDDSYALKVVLPDNSKLGSEDSEGYENFLIYHFSNILLLKSGITPQQLAMLNSYPETNIALEPESYEPSDDFLSMDEDNLSISYIVCYINMMLLYFMVLFYGQGVANAVISEKTSKLMDFFLVTVKPAAMVLGKVFAVALAAILQLGIWLISLLCGISLGAFVGGKISGTLGDIISSFIEGLDMLSGMFSLPSIIVALLITASGLLLYSALASIGGSLASKPEDLASTNQVFSLVLVASFLAVVFVGGTPSAGSSAILNWIPFTSVLITPGRILAGDVGALEGIVYLAIVMAFSVLVTYFAGKIYKMMSLYKGDVPKIGKVIEMFKNTK